MSNRSGDKGTKAETAVCKVIEQAGFTARRIRTKGVLDQGDVHLWTHSDWLVAVEVKWRPKWQSSAQIEAWLVEAEREANNADADIAVLVVNRPGTGYANAGRWYTYMRSSAWHGVFGRTDTRARWVCVELDHLLEVLP